MAPTLASNGRIQLLISGAVFVAYILVMCIRRPWRYWLTHWADLLLRLGLLALVLTASTLNDPASAERGLPNEDAKGNIQLAILILPALLLLLLLFRFLWFRKVARVASLKKRTRFAQRLDDLCEILRSESALDMRAYAFRLQDNDVLKLDQALDTLQYTFLGLQPRSILKRRCDAVPFEVA